MKNLLEDYHTKIIFKLFCHSSQSEGKGLLGDDFIDQQCNAIAKTTR